MYKNAAGVELRLSGATQNTVSSAGAGQKRDGTQKNDIFYSKAGDTLAGGLGDDTYQMWSADVKIVEKAGQGVDTIIARYYGKITMPDNVENLILQGKGMTGATGNALDNIIIAGDVGAVLDGGAGNDVLVGSAATDMFKMSAGNGSDVITNFAKGQDVIQLSGYGLSSYDQLHAMGKQVGSDTVFTFANKESLVLRGVNLSELNGFDFGFALNKPVARAVDTVLDGAMRAQNMNGWYVFNNTYNTGALKYGTDYSVSTTVNKADATAGTTFTWKMPYTIGETPKILAYPEVIFGVPPMGAFAKNPGDKLAVFPVKVGDLVSLKADYDVTFSGNVSGFNVAYDIWLTSKPNGDRSTISNEIMVWVHKGDVPTYGTAIGTYTAGDVTYTIYNKGTYTAFVADRDVPKGDLDIAAMVTHLKKIGIVKDTEYLASIELGAEVISGVGSLTINNLDLSVGTRGANGSVIVKDVTGAGQSMHEVPLLKQLFKAGIEERLDGVQSVGRTITTVDDSLVTRKNVDAADRVVSIEKITAEKDGTLSTKHFSESGAFLGADIERRTNANTVNTERYDANWKFVGADAVQRKDSGEVVTTHYDAKWKVTGADSVQTKPNGDVVTIHFDSAWKITGSESVVKAANGDVTTHFYDAKFKLTGADVRVIDKAGDLIVHHYNGSWKLTGAEKLVTAADGSVSTYHFDGKWGLTGFDSERVGTDGVAIKQSFDAKFKMTETEFTGTHGADTITGTSGTNVFHGGFGSDVLRAGKGADTFVFDTTIGNGDVDRIIGFDTAKDKIVLDKAVFDGLSAGALAGDAFVVGTAARDANDRVIYDQSTGSLFYDADGSGSGKAVQFAKLDPNTVLTASHFEVMGADGQFGVGTSPAASPLAILPHLHDYL